MKAKIRKKTVGRQHYWYFQESGRISDGTVMVAAFDLPSPTFYVLEIIKYEICQIFQNKDSQTHKFFKQLGTL